MVNIKDLDAITGHVLFIAKNYNSPTVHTRFEVFGGSATNQSYSSNLLTNSHLTIHNTGAMATRPTVTIASAEGKPSGETHPLPAVFKSPIRPDIVQYGISENSMLGDQV
jgi:hypothetical protein